MIFDGIESLTDLVFYILYKYYKNHPIWNNLESIGLDSCRYITDFGIELFSHATQKIKLVRNLNGCKKIFKYLYDDVRLDHTFMDLFLCNEFNKLHIKNAESVKLNSYKVLILNESSNSLLEKIEADNPQKRSFKNKLIDYTRMALAKNSNSAENIILNIFEINLVSSYALVY